MIGTVAAQAFLLASLLLQAPAREGKRAPAAAPVTREEMARAYLGFDRVATERLPSWTTERREEVNHAFDAVTMLFFGADMARAMEKLNALTVSIAAANPEEERRIGAVLAGRWEITPRWMLKGSEPIVELVDRRGRREGANELRQRVVVRSDAMAASWSVDVPVTAVGTCSIRLGDGPDLPSGSYRFILRCEGTSFERPIGRIAVLGEHPDAIAKRFGAELDALEKSGAGRERDRATLASRLKLLTSTPSNSRSSQFLADPAQLVRELAEELAAVGRGDSPWQGRRGDFWRTIRAVAADVPCRVYVPESLTKESRPALLIALHGAGGDESMFMDGYGGGQLKGLAAKYGFVVVAPATTSFALTPVVFESIVEEMTFCAGIDPDRVFLLGHSMGAGAAGSITELRPGRVAAVAMLAGMGGTPDTSWPPTMIVAGGLDPLFPIARMQASAEQGKAAGATVRFVASPHDGHTLVVTAMLPSVVEWMMSLPGRAEGRAAD
ncbi:MAG: hypothetical protein JNL80_00355 [Phycisphaerae bacterium]|jgi:predicted esterase|nr:hypothetical protein [Phycisphaerae bacterium]